MKRNVLLLRPRCVCNGPKISQAATNVKFSLYKYTAAHGLRTPNEGINQRNLKIWADVADMLWPYLKNVLKLM